MVKAWLLGLAAALVLFAGDATGSSLSRQDVSIPMDDGVSIAATLYLPDAAPPAGGWPAVILMHGFGGNRESMNTLATSFGLAGQEYAVLTFDARGHGQSGGLVSVDGPREITDTRAVFQWLANRPDVDDANIGAWGISYGGGAALNSLVAGVPWGAVVAVETWSDLYAALMPQNLVKSGLVAGLGSLIPEAKRDPSMNAVIAAAFAGNVPAVKPWAAARSSLPRLGTVTTPVFLAPGRRDFLFGIDQGTQAYLRLRGPKAIYFGLHGHAPSTFPAADTTVLMTHVRAWFDCWLRDRLCDPARASVYLAPETFRGQVTRRGATLPPTSPRVVAFPGVTTFARTGRLTRTSAPLRTAVEVFGPPAIKLTAATSGGWSRLVAVLTARTPQGKEIVVSAGGIPTTNGVRKRTIRLGSQATFIPRGSRLTLHLGASSLAHSSSNILYLDLPMAPTARVRVGNAVLTLPVLKSPVTR